MRGATEIPGPRIPALEGLRGLCALSVLFSHLAYKATSARTGGASFFPGYPAHFIASFGNVGVLIFFVLSGYVIGLSTTHSFSAPAARSFLRRRLVRLYPIYLLIIVVSFAIAGEPLLSRSFLVHLAFLQTWLEPAIATNLVLWTLHMEMMFYLLFLLVWSDLVSLRVAMVISAACCIISPFTDLHFVRVGAYFFVWLLGLCASRVRAPASALDGAFFWPAVLIGIAASRLSAIELGALKWQVSGHGQLTTISVLAMSGTLLAPVLVVGGAGSPRMRKLVLASIGISAVACVVALAHALQPHVPRVPNHAVATCFLALGLLAAAMRWPPPTSLLASLGWLGGLSYAMYVVQHPTAIVVFAFVPAGQSAAVWWCASLAVLGVVFALAYVMERRFQAAVVGLAARAFPSPLRPPLDELKHTRSMSE